jgi:hypothetical protein
MDGRSLTWFRPDFERQFRRRRTRQARPASRLAESSVIAKPHNRTAIDRPRVNGALLSRVARPNDGVRV